MKKSIIYTIIGLFSLSFSSNISAQNPKTVEAEFRVDGVCKMCKTRIENAAYIKGVKFTEWSKETQTLKVAYNTTKTDLESIHASIAAIGHSTSMVEADTIAYKKLPACCAYQDGVEVH